MQKHGERISRRNVLAPTGGGMSTLHKLMSQVEDVEALKASASASVLSESLVNTVLAETGRQVQIAREPFRLILRVPAKTGSGNPGSVF